MAQKLQDNEKREKNLPKNLLLVDLRTVVPVRRIEDDGGFSKPSSAQELDAPQVKEKLVADLKSRGMDKLVPEEALNRKSVKLAENETPGTIDKKIGEIGTFFEHANRYEWEFRDFQGMLGNDKLLDLIVKRTEGMDKIVGAGDLRYSFAEVFRMLLNEKMADWFFSNTDKRLSEIISLSSKEKYGTGIINALSNKEIGEWYIAAETHNAALETFSEMKDKFSETSMYYYLFGTLENPALGKWLVSNSEEAIGAFSKLVGGFDTNTTMDLLIAIRNEAAGRWFASDPEGCIGEFSAFIKRMGKDANNAIKTLWNESISTVYANEQSRGGIVASLEKLFCPRTNEGQEEYIIYDRYELSSLLSQGKYFGEWLVSKPEDAIGTIVALQDVGNCRYFGQEGFAREAFSIFTNDRLARLLASDPDLVLGDMNKLKGEGEYTQGLDHYAFGDLLGLLGTERVAERYCKNHDEVVEAFGEMRSSVWDRYGAYISTLKDDDGEFFASNMGLATNIATVFRDRAPDILEKVMKQQGSNFLEIENSIATLKERIPNWRMGAIIGAEESLDLFLAKPRQFAEALIAILDASGEKAIEKIADSPAIFAKNMEDYVRIANESGPDAWVIFPFYAASEKVREYVKENPESVAAMITVFGKIKEQVRFEIKTIKESAKIEMGGGFADLAINAFMDRDAAQALVDYCKGNIDFETLMLLARSSPPYAIELCRPLDELAIPHSEENERKRKIYLDALTGAGKEVILSLLCTNPEAFFPSTNNRLFTRLSGMLENEGTSMTDYLHDAGLGGTPQYRNFIFRAMRFNRLYNQDAPPFNPQANPNGEGVPVFKTKEEMNLIFTELAAPLDEKGFDPVYTYLLANNIKNMDPEMKADLKERLSAAAEAAESPLKKIACSALIDIVDGKITTQEYYEPKNYTNQDPELGGVGKLLAVQVFDPNGTRGKVLATLENAELAMTWIETVTRKTLDENSEQMILGLGKEGDEASLIGINGNVLVAFKEGKYEIVEKSHWEMTKDWYSKNGAIKPKVGKHGEMIYEDKYSITVLHMGETGGENNLFLSSMLEKNPHMVLTFRGHAGHLKENIDPSIFGNRPDASIIFVPGNCNSAGDIPEYLGRNPLSSLTIISNRGTGYGQTTNSVVQTLINAAAKYQENGSKYTYEELIHGKKADDNNFLKETDFGRALILRNGGTPDMLDVSTAGERVLTAIYRKASESRIAEEPGHTE